MVSLLLANGHLDAWNYPIGMILIETEFIRKRERNLEATRATLLHSAVLAVLDSDKALKAFNAVIKDMHED